ncbi:MAG: hypothetical protein ACREPY_14500 [Rhodanobacteraceae bacterium]
MNLRLLLAALALLALPSLCAAAADHVETIVYEGSLGSQRIVMKLPEHPAQAMSGFFEPTWFFPRYGIDHRLDLIAASKDRMQMVASGQESPQWKLARQADGSWQGTRKQPDGRTLPVFLQRAVLPLPPANASDYLKRARTHQPYVYLRLQDIKLQPGRREAFMGYTLQWWREPRSRIELFQVADGYPAAQRKHINRALMDELWTQVNGYYSCVGAPVAGGSVEFSATPTLLSDTVVSVATIGNYYCGGAHGGTNYAGINLNARTGSKLALADVIELGKRQPTQYAYAHAFAPWLREQLGALYPEHMHDGCHYADAGNDTWLSPGWYMTAKGIFFIPYFPHVVGACTYIDDWSLLPWHWFDQHHAKLKLPLPGTPPTHGSKVQVAASADHPQTAPITLEKGKQQSFMGFTLQWWREPVSGLRMFQIVSHGQIQQSFTRANHALMQQLWKQLGHYYACQYSPRAKPAVNVRPTYLSPSIVSVDVSISHVATFVNHLDMTHGCGDLSDIRAPITLDIASGQRLSQSGIFDVAANAATPSDAERQTAGWLVKQFTAIYPERMSGIEPICNFANPRIWMGAKWYLTPQGIFFYPDFTRAPQSSYVCAASDDWSLLPWARLKDHPGRFKLKLPEST